MYMIYKFTGKKLFYLTGVILILSVILAPVGIYFIYLGHNAYIRIEKDAFIYKMFTKKVIPFTSITKLSVAQVAQGRYMISPVVLTLVTVVPLIIEYGDGKKVKLSLNYFEKPQEIAKILADKTGHKIEIPDELKDYIEQK